VLAIASVSAVWGERLLPSRVRRAGGDSVEAVVGTG
jgi:hypothetical protein